MLQERARYTSGPLSIAQEPALSLEGFLDSKADENARRGFRNGKRLRPLTHSQLITRLERERMRQQRVLRIALRRIVRCHSRRAVLRSELAAGTGHRRPAILHHRRTAIIVRVHSRFGQTRECWCRNPEQDAQQHHKPAFSSNCHRCARLGSALLYVQTVICITSAPRQPTALLSLRRNPALHPTVD